MKGNEGRGLRRESLLTNARHVLEQAKCFAYGTAFSPSDGSGRCAGISLFIGEKNEAFKGYVDCPELQSMLQP